MRRAIRVLPMFFKVEEHSDGTFHPIPPDSVLTPQERAYVRECKAAKAAAASERNQRRSSPTKQASRAELKQADPQPEPEEL